MKYCIDCNFFITAWRMYYSPEISTDFWEWLADHAKNSKIFIPQEAYEEIEIGKDNLFKWMQNIKKQIVYDMDNKTQEELVKIMILPQAIKLADSNKKDGADVFIAAYAKRHNATVVSNDNKVIELCKACNVRVIYDHQFLKEQNLKLSVFKSLDTVVVGNKY